MAMYDAIWSQKLPSKVVGKMFKMNSDLNLTSPSLTLTLRGLHFLL